MIKKLSNIDCSVPARTCGRKASHRERYCLKIYLVQLSQSGILKFPLRVDKAEAPDFFLSSNDKTTTLEVTETSTENYQRAMTELAKSPEGTILEKGTNKLIKLGGCLIGRGWKGNSVETGWVDIILNSIINKTTSLNKPHFKFADRDELLIYDNSPVSVMLHVQEALPLLRKAIHEKLNIKHLKKRFHAISVIHNELLYDIGNIGNTHTPKGVTYLGFCVLFLLSGCASTSTFSSYTSQLNPVIRNLRENKSLDLKTELAKKVNSGDKILYLMERGRIAQIQGDVDTSRANFEAAIQAVKESDEKALISASGAAAQAGAVIVNDNAIPYKGDGYERVMLYNFQAMNYLAENDIEGAGVEARRANAEQEEALKRHEKEMEQAKESARQNHVSDNPPDAVTDAYMDMDRIAGKVRNSFQNAYSFYLSGIVYEMLGQPNDAYIDYKKAMEIFPDNTYLRKDVIRLAKQLNMRDDWEHFKYLYPQAAETLPQNNADNSELILFFEDDFVAQKEQIKIPIPISTRTINFTAVAFPVYNIKSVSCSPIALSENGNLLGISEPICDVNTLAVKSLKEKVPAIAIRCLISACAKAAFAKTAEDKAGLIGSLCASAYNIFSENADLRSWVTLPADVQIMRIKLPAGEHDFLLAHQDSGASCNSKVNIKENSRNIIRVVRAGDKLYYRVMP